MDGKTGSTLITPSSISIYPLNMYPLLLAELVLVYALSIQSATAFLLPFSRQQQPDSRCHSFQTSFPSSAVSPRGTTTGAPFVAISSPQSYEATGRGLKLFLGRPTSEVTTANGVNNYVGEGATINSTFTMRYGKVTWVISTDEVPGVVTAAIFIADKFEGDEIDLEFLGSDPTHWQTNVFAPAPQDTSPLYGKLSSIENVPGKQRTISQPHAYTIDWNPSRIIWSVDGTPVRTLTQEQSRINGTIHYPTDPMRIQMGIWDASSPIGTAEWAGGPINWSKAPKRISATFHSITVECS